MTPTEIGWDEGLGGVDTLYIYAKDPRSKLWQRKGRVCDVFSKPSDIPFGDPTWWVSFMLTIDGRNPHGPYRTKDEAKAMAITLYKLNP